MLLHITKNHMFDQFSVYIFLLSSNEIYFQELIQASESKVEELKKSSEEHKASIIEMKQKIIDADNRIKEIEKKMDVVSDHFFYYYLMTFKKTPPYKFKSVLNFFFSFIIQLLFYCNNKKSLNIISIMCPCMKFERNLFCINLSFTLVK